MSNMIERWACNICVDSCNNNAIEYEEKHDVCFRLQPETSPRVVDEDLCNGCGKCAINCSLNNILGSDAGKGKRYSEHNVALKVENGAAVHRKMEGCITCIVCNGRPACIDHTATPTRESIHHFLLSIIDYGIYKISFIFNRLIKPKRVIQSG